MKTKPKRLRPPVKIHGGKYYLAPWIIEHLPPWYPSARYIEPFAGGASVLLQKEPSALEVINDVDPGMMSIWAALKTQPQRFVDELQAIPYCEDSFVAAIATQSGLASISLESAVNQFVLRRMSRGGLKTAFAWSDRLRGGKPGDVNAWETILDQLPLIAQRVQGVELCCQRAEDLIITTAVDAPALTSVGTKTIYYVDPPYLPETRTAKSAYQHELDYDGHAMLCRILLRLPGTAAVMVSGYDNPLYNDLFTGWRKATKKIANHSSQAKTKQTRYETLWMNY